MVDFSGVIGKKEDSWLCCVKVSNEETALNEFLKNLRSNNERYTSRITQNKDGSYSVITNTKHNIIDLDNLTRDNKDKYYTIVFKIDTNNIINPLYLIPYPCKNNYECDKIKGL